MAYQGIADLTDTSPTDLSPRRTPRNLIIFWSPVCLVLILNLFPCYCTFLPDRSIICSPPRISSYLFTYSYLC